jgi:hypothetical protein
MVLARKGVRMRGTRTGTMSLSTTLRRVCLAGGLTLSLTLAFAASAWAVSGTPIKIAEPIRFGSPSVAVDSAGTAYIAWAHEVVGGEELVEYCVLPAGATGCAHSGNLTVAGNKEQDDHIERVQVLIDGTTVIVLANLYGVEEEFAPAQEWQSTDGGATFNAVNGGKSVARATVDADTGAIGAVVVPGSDALGYAAVTAEGPPTFDEFPLSTPPTCSVKKPCPYATLQAPSLNELGNLGGVVASQLGTNPGVLGVYETLGKPGCASGTFDTAYVYGNGEQSATNSYDLSPGMPKSAWKELTAGDCEAEYPAVGGGPSGFGVVEDDLTRGYTVYHAFDETNHNFDTPYVTIAPEFEENPSVSQDGSGGIYATFSSGDGGEIRLAYSSNGGASWTGPATIDPITGDSHLTSAVGSNGQGWATWQVGESVYAQQFVASDAISPAISPPAPGPAATTLTTTQASGTTKGADISISAGTIGESDTATITGTNASSATGTVDFALYDNSSCSGTPTFSGTAEATGGTAAIADDASPGLPPGKYYWRAVYSGNATNASSTSACGSEVLTVTPAATAGGSGTSTGSTVTITITCSGPCTVTITLTIPTASASRKSKKKPKSLTLATGTFTLPNGGTKKLTLHLTKAGRKAFAAHHGRLSASLLLSEKIDGHTILSTKTVKIAPAKSKHKK